MNRSAKNSAKIIGIDLGTTYSVVSIWDQERNEAIIIPNLLGNHLTPSVVSVNAAGQVIVGEEAKRNIAFAPENTVSEILREIGQDFKVTLWDEEFNPQTISAFILYYLKICAEQYLGEPVHSAVITIPACFTEVQKSAVCDAARMAGLNVHQLISSATAAAIAYWTREARKGPEREEKVYAIYDFGGGTFNVSIIVITSHTIRVIGTYGHPRLGGLELDEAITKWSLHQIKQKYRVDLHDDEAAKRGLKVEAEDIKKVLVIAENATLNVPYLTVVEGKPVNVNLQLSRKQFDMLISPLIEKSLSGMEEAVKSAKEHNQRGWTDLDGVLLVGGPTRIHKIREMLQEKLREHRPSEELEIRADLNVDEVVAMGAAYVATNLTSMGWTPKVVEVSSKEDIQEIKHKVSDIVDAPTVNIFDVAGHSLGIAIDRGRFYKLIEKDTVLPETKSLTGLTNAADFTTELHVEVYQGEEEFVAANTKVGQVLIEGLEPLPSGQQMLEVTFTLDVSGTLSIVGTDLRTQKTYEDIFLLDGITPLSADGLRAKRALFDGWPVQLPAEHRYHELMAQVERPHDPRERLSLAKELFTFSKRRFPNIQTRLNILQQAVQLDPFSVRYRVALAQAEREGGLLDEAIAECRSALDHWPDSPPLHLLLGEVFLDKGEIGEARKHFEKVAESADPIARTRAIYNKIECDLREASDKKDWEAVLDGLNARLISVSDYEVSVSHYEVLDLSPKSLANLDDEELRKTVRAAGKKARRAYTKAAQRGDKDAEAKINRINQAETILRDSEARKAYNKLLIEYETSTAERETAIGLFCEKCLKVMVECNDKDIVQQMLEMVQEKVGAEAVNNKAFQLIQRLSQFDPQQRFKDNGSKSEDLGRLEGLLRAYRLSQTKSVVEASDEETRIQTAGNWRNLVEAQRDHWPGLSEAYQHELDKWAQQAYKGKSFVLAGVLWQEAERLAPYNPSLLQNLAIVHTRLEQENGYHWYWDRLTQTWTLYGEMMPEADGFAKLMLQKHQAFANAAQAKLPMLQTWQELLEVGEIWMREAISYLVLQQLTFRNSYYRCGVRTDDWTKDEERKELFDVAYKSATCWLDMVAQWQGLGKESTLAQWRQEQLSLSRQVISESSEDRYRHYDEEKDAFQHHRENRFRQYSLLFLQVLMPLAGQIDFDDKKVRKQYAFIGRGLLSFPHRLHKLDLVKILSDQRDRSQNRDEQVYLSDLIEMAEKDSRGLVQNYAISPWFNRAQRFMQAGNSKQAAILLEEMLEIEPNFALGMFYLARCWAEGEKFEDAYQLLLKARENCNKEDELLTHIDNLIDQMDIARVSKRLEPAQKLLKDEKASDAIQECEKVLQDYPGHSYVLFVLSQAYVDNLDIEKAKSTLRKAQKASRDDNELREAIDQQLKQVTEFGPQIILSKAVPEMQKMQWQIAQEILAKGRGLKSKSAQVTFYEAVCWGRMEKTKQAERVAREALQQCSDDESDLKQEIENFIKQIPLMNIAEEFEKAQRAMGRKHWKEALGYLDAALSKSPRVVSVLFYKALCHFRLEEWDEAEKVAEKTLPLCGADDTHIQEQLEIILQQIPLVRVAKDMQKAEEAIKRERWKNALEHLDIVVRESPKHVAALFYQALCHFRLKNFDQAEDIAQRARDLCGTGHEQIKEQLDVMLSQMDEAREATALEPITQAINRKDWTTGLKEAKSYLWQRESTNPAALFYKALCEWNLGKKKDAKQTAEDALPYATGAQYGSIREQLEQIIQAADTPNWVGDMNKAVQEMNAENWAGALGHLNNVINADSTNAQAYYYRALCQHQSGIGMINTLGGVKPDNIDFFVTWFEKVESDLENAESYRSFSDYDLRSTISKLRDAMENILSQLKKARGY